MKALLVACLISASVIGFAHPASAASCNQVSIVSELHAAADALKHGDYHAGYEKSTDAAASSSTCANAFPHRSRYFALSFLGDALNLQARSAAGLARPGEAASLRQAAHHAYEIVAKAIDAKPWLKAAAQVEALVIATALR